VAAAGPKPFIVLCLRIGLRDHDRICLIVARVSVAFITMLSNIGLAICGVVDDVLLATATIVTRP
jgi:hypothetical protein